MESAADLKANMSQAEESLRTLRAVGDKLTPQVLLRANITHATNLSKRQKELERSRDEEDLQELQTIADVSVELGKLTDETRALILEKTGKPKSADAPANPG
jgi:hypothetical protein